ncbi:MAG: TrmB family transcriptional regulator [Bacillota bacterium]
MPDNLSDELVKSFLHLGLTTYEAMAYIALLRRHPVNGHEISRLSGVPGPKIYETLDRLTRKGLVAPLQTEPVTYEPLPYIEFLKYKENETKSNIRFLQENLDKLVTTDSPHLIWHIRGYGALMAKAGEIINSSEDEVLISFWEEQAKDITGPLSEAVKRNVRVISMQFGPGTTDIGTVYRHILLDTIYKRHGNEMTLAADNKYGFFMNLAPGGEWEGYWTSNPGVIRMVTNYIRHDIYVNKLIMELGNTAFDLYGPQLEGLLNI